MFKKVDVYEWEDHGDFITVSLDDVIDECDPADLALWYEHRQQYVDYDDNDNVPCDYEQYDKVELAQFVKQICEVNHRVFTKKDLREALEELIEFLPLAEK